jgi:hypothetical protein
VADLEDLLGYRGAEAHGEPVEVAGDIIAMPFWTGEFCALVVRAAEAAGGFAEDPDDPVPGREVSLMAIAPRLFEHLQNDIGRRLWPAIRRWWPLVDYHGLRDAFVIRYAQGEQESLREHHDVAQVSASIKLNDDYRGAELEFPRQGWSNTAVPVGDIVAWPSLVTHPHRGAPIIGGVKYSLTVWCELPIV